MSDRAARLASLGLALPDAPTPPGRYVSVYRHGDLCETAGHLPFVDGEMPITGALGAALDVEAGRSAARIATLNALSSMVSHLGGNLDRIVRIVKMRGYVTATADFAEHHLVTNAASELILDVFGTEAGAHVRASVGVPSLPFNGPVEIEISALVRD
ncbi:MAG: RidA family protein [Cryobacterium sp.]|nr:RidA family protein [Cryobacterium sp.]